jgi:hypothetical protein
MQVAHPLIAEGVDQHSDFRIDPWGRLRATIRSYLTIVYGSTPTARAEIRRLSRLHRTIVGPVRDPAATAATGATAYSARDPALSLWVHATLVDSTIVAHDAWIEPLSRSRRERFYAETRPIGRAFGVPERALPATLAEFEAYLGSMPERTTVRGPTSIERPDDPSTAARPARGDDPAAARRSRRRDLHRWHLVALAAASAVPTAAYDWTVWPAIASSRPRSAASSRSVGRRPATRRRLAGRFRTWRRILRRRGGRCRWRWPPTGASRRRRRSPGDRDRHRAAGRRPGRLPRRGRHGLPASASSGMRSTGSRIALMRLRISTPVCPSPSPCRPRPPRSPSSCGSRLPTGSRRPAGCRDRPVGRSGGVDGALTIAFTRMDRIIEIDRANLLVVTQPGIVNAALKAAVAAEGCSTRRTRRARAVLHRGQPRHERRWTVLRQVRPDAQFVLGLESSWPTERSSGPAAGR